MAMNSLSIHSPNRFRLIAAVALFFLASGSLIPLAQSVNTPPSINAQACAYDGDLHRLIIKGDGFQTDSTVQIVGQAGEAAHGRTKIKNSRKIIITDIADSDLKLGVDVTVTNPGGNASPTVRLIFDSSTDHMLTGGDVQTIIAQAVAQAQASGLRATVAVVDTEANVLGVFRMNGAPADTLIGVGKHCPQPSDCGLEGLRVPSGFAAISKAGTGAFLSSQGHAFTTRTASFIVQEHFPPGVSFTSGGPLFGVQFSQLPCGDINPVLPLGLSADPGGVPLYKNGIRAGGIGIEGDGRYSLDADPRDDDQPVEELVAVAGSRGFEAPAAIRGDQIIVNGIRFPFVNTALPAQLQVQDFAQLRGSVDPGFPIRAALPSQFHAVTVDGVQGQVSDRFFPPQSSRGLTANEVQLLLLQAARQAFITRGAIRVPEGSAAQVNIAVVDVDGIVLGIFSTPDAAIFGFDVCVQKARTAAFLSRATSAAELQAAEHGKFVKYLDAATRDGVKLDGSVAFSDRAAGFLSRPFFPDGIDETDNGPFSKRIDQFSPFNDGLQLDLVKTALGLVLNGQPQTSCTAIRGLENGLQIFPGSVPLYKNGRLVGAIGVSGDGVDQDDLIAAMGSSGFEAPDGVRSDRVFVRGVRLPYVKFPRQPNR